MFLPKKVTWVYKELAKNPKLKGAILRISKTSLVYLSCKWHNPGWTSGKLLIHHQVYIHISRKILS